MSPRTTREPETNPSAESEADLITALRAGSAAAFEKLVRDNIAQLQSTAIRLLRNRHDADEAVQEAFLAAFRTVKAFEARSRLGTWLHRIVVNAALMKLRSRRRDLAAGGDATLEESSDPLATRFARAGGFLETQTPWMESTHEHVLRSEERQLVRDRIAELPESLRTALILHDFEQLSYEEIGECLGLSANAVKIRAHRARQRLRDLLAPQFEMPGTRQ